MPFCPACKQEFVEEVTECPEDHVALVAELPFQTVPAEGATWVEIASTGTENEASLLQGFLRAEGIPAQIENVKFNMEPINFGSMGDIRVYVGADDEQRAMELLRRRNTEYDKLEEDGETIVTDEGPATIDDAARTEAEPSD